MDSAAPSTRAAAMPPPQKNEPTEPGASAMKSLMDGLEEAGVAPGFATEIKDRRVSANGTLDAVGTTPEEAIALETQASKVIAVVRAHKVSEAEEGVLAVRVQLGA